MGFLDNTGLSYFFEKIKDIFTRSVNGAKPDNNGDIQITSVTVADNLIGSDNQFSADQFAYRNSGGDTTTITSNKGQLVYLDGAVQISSGNIATIAKPSKIVSTGFNSFNAADGNMYINDATISNGTIISNAGSYVGFCRAVGNIPNGYVAYSGGGGITGIGWSSALPSLGTNVSTTSASVTASLASISFENNGYIAVAISSNNLAELCIHPKLDGSADTVFEAYTSASEIALPTTDINGTALPTYGMPAVNGIRDRFDFKRTLRNEKASRNDGPAALRCTGRRFFLSPLTIIRHPQIMPFFKEADRGTTPRSFSAVRFRGVSCFFMISHRPAARPSVGRAINEGFL